MAEVTATKWNPKAYQRRAVRYMVQQGAAGLFLDPGLGKTSIAYAAYLLLQKLNPGMLVVCPLRPAQLVWPAEAKKWSEFKDLKVTLLHGPEKEARLLRAADVYVINPEGLEWLFDTLKKRFRRKPWPFQILTVDESSKFRNHRSLRFRLLKKQLRHFKRRYALTGTPAPKSLLNLWAQAYILDQGHALGRYYTQFKDEFFDSTGWGGFDHVPKPGAEKVIYAKLRPLVLRMSAEDYLELPPLHQSNVYVELPSNVRKQYDRMEKDLFMLIDDRVVTAANAGVATNKCRQIANGGVFTTVKQWKNLHWAKTEAVTELLDELQGQPALVSYEYQHDLERLRTTLKKAGYGNVPHIGGGVSEHEAKELERAWNAGELPVLLGQPQSVALGLNLQGGRAVIWHSLPWDLELYMQMYQRVHRQGQKFPVFMYHVVAVGTVDEAVLGALASKARNQRTLLQALQGYRRTKVGLAPAGVGLQAGRGTPAGRGRLPGRQPGTPKGRLAGAAGAGRR